MVQREKRRRRRRAAAQPADVEVLPGYDPPPAVPTMDPLAEFVSGELADNLIEENFSETDSVTESEVEFTDQAAAKPCTYVQKDRNGIQASTSSCDEQMQAMCSTNITG